MYAEIVEAIQAHASWYIVGAGTLALGIFLLMDDVNDFAEFSREDHPFPLHHYQYGLLLIICAVCLFCIGGCFTWADMRGRT